MYSCEHKRFLEICVFKVRISHSAPATSSKYSIFGLITMQACLDDIMYLEHYDSLVPTNDFHAMHTFQVCYSAAAFDVHLPS